MKQTRVTVNAAIVVTAMAAFTSTAHAQGPATNNTVAASAVEPNPQPAFGRRGQWYLYAPSLLALHNHYQGSPMVSGNMVSLAMELGTFIRDHFSLGIWIGGQYSWQESQDASPSGSDSYENWGTDFGLLAGWQRPISSWVSFWPKLYVGGAYGRADGIAYDAESGAQSKQQFGTYSVNTNVRLPLVLHLTRHMFMEIAYQVSVGIGHSHEFDSVQTTGQTSFGFGGWL